MILEVLPKLNAKSPTKKMQFWKCCKRQQKDGSAVPPRPVLVRLFITHRSNHLEN